MLGFYSLDMSVQLAGFHIERFRGIQDLRLPIRSATSLIGANGAGKSSILEALGYDPTEEGALEREQDAAAVVWWYFDVTEGQVLRDALWKSLPPGPASRRVVDLLAPALVAKLGRDGPEVALDLFGLLEGEVPKHGSADGRVRVQALREALSDVGADVAWLRGVLDNLPAIGSSPYLLDLGVRCPGLELPERPEVVSMVVDADDISALLYRRTERLLAAWLDPLLAQRPDLAEAMEWMALGFLRPALEAKVLQPVLTALGDMASSLLPAFVAGNGQLRLDLRDGPDSVVGAVERLLAEADGHLAQGADAPESLRHARLELRKLDDTIDLHLEAFLRAGSEGVEFHYSRLGTGVRRWITGAVDEAARRLLRVLRDPTFTSEQRALAVEAERLPSREAVRGRGGGPTLRLIDEPVACLEQRAHRDVMRWLRRRREANETLILATHQAAVLQEVRLPDRDELVVGVWRDKGAVHAAPIGVRLLDALDQRRDELGLSPPELLFTARAVLAVEGPHDAQLLRALYGRQLDECGVVFVIVGGSTREELGAAILQTMYGKLRLPVWFLLDRPADDPTKTEEGLSKAVDQLTALEVPLSLLRLDVCDIVGALSPDALRAAFPNGSFPSTEEAIRKLQKCGNSDGVKKLVAKWAYPAAASTKTADLVANVCEYVQRSDLGDRAAGQALRDVMERFFEEVNERTRGLYPEGKNVVPNLP